MRKEKEDARGGPAQEACRPGSRMPQDCIAHMVLERAKKHTSNWLQMHKGSLHEV